MVNTKDGQPIPGALITLERTDTSWSRKLAPTDAHGKTMQLGLEPKEFTITVSAPGFLPVKVKGKVPLNDALRENFVLITADQASAAPQASLPVASGSSGDLLEEGSNAYSTGVGLFKQKKYVEALPFIGQAFQNLTAALAGLKDPAAKAELLEKLPAIERLYGINLVEAGKADGSKPALILQAEPFLLRAFEKNPKDIHVVACLLEVAEAKQDAELTAKYQAALDALIGPRPGELYNKAVTEFEANHPGQSKKLLLQIIAIEPKFTDSYYLLGVVEYSLSRGAEAKAAFQKYLEKAPTGTRAAEVKELLKEIK